MLAAGPVQSLLVNRSAIDGVVPAPGGAHFTSCVPDYGRDEAFQREYARSAGSEDTWRRFEAGYLSGGENAYAEAVRRFHAAAAETA
jgi:glutaconate CoA-transferase, subunit A